MIAAWRSRTFAVAALAVVTALVGACSAVVTSTPAPTFSPEVAACHADDTAGDPSHVVTIGNGASGAVLLAAPVAGDASLIHLDACRWERTPSGVLATDSSGGTVSASVPSTVSVDRAVTTGMEPTEHVIGGRAAPVVATVQVTLSDGSVKNGVVSGGYWLAWWAGPAGSAHVTALDVSGTSLSDTPFTAPSR